jgi:hypothetical protein
VSVTVHAGRSRYPRWPSKAGFADGYWADFMARFADGVFDPRITHTRASTATYIDRDGYLRTAAANVPRITYDPVTLQCRGYLHEAQTTNLLTYSQDFSNAAWSMPNGGSKVSTARAAPDGTSSAGEVQLTAQYHCIGQLKNGMSIGQVYAFSVWVRVVSGNTALHLTTESPFESTAITASGSWQRFTHTFTAAGADIFFQVQDRNASGLPTVVQVWGAQLEVNPAATSYIPTAGSAVTRAADIAYIDVATHLAGLSQTDSTFFVEAQALWSTSNARIIAGTTAAETFLQDGAIPTRVGTFDGTAAIEVTSANFVSAPQKMASSFRLNARSVAMEGSITNGASNATPATTRVYVGSVNGNANFFNGTYKSLKVWKRGFSAAETVALTVEEAGSSAWTPAQLAGLALWLDADDASTITLNSGNVSQWNDKSGNARHATQGVAASQPAFNASGLGGKPVITLDGTNDSLRISIPNSVIANTTHGLYYVFARKGAGTGGDAYRPEISTTTSAFNVDRGGYHYIKNTNNLGASYPYYPGTGPSSNNYDLSSGIAYANDVRTIIALQGNTTGWGVWRTGALEGTTAALVTPHSSIEGLVIGHQPSPSRFSNIEIVEVLLVNDVSTSTRQLIEGYLAWKWGLTYALPANHPYRWDTSLFGGTDLNGFDTDAKAYIASVETADVQELELGVKTAINNFVVGCKADGIWNAIKSSCILAGARTLAGALQPLVGTAPTNFNFVSGDYSRTTGLVGNGTTKYLNSNRNSTSDPNSSIHLAVHINTAHISGVGAYIGVGAGTTGATSVFSNRSSNEFAVRNRNSTTNTIAAASAATGFVGTSRASSSAYLLRVNNSSTSFTADAQASIDANHFIFGRNASGSEAFTTGRLSFYSIGQSLDLALLDTRVTALIAAYGAAI